MLGGIFLGGYVDRSKNYKNVTLACLGVTAAMILARDAKAVRKLIARRDGVDEKVTLIAGSS